MTPEDRARFYAQRDARTIAYGSTDAALDRPVRLVIRAAAATRPGQIALLALANMVVRTQRSLHVSLPDVPLRARALVERATLAEALTDTVMAINPALTLSIVMESCLDLEPAVVDPVLGHGNAITIGIGNDAIGTADLFLGWTGGRAELSIEPVATGGTEGDVLGAATAACLGAAAVFHLSHGRSIAAVQVNLVERRAAPIAGQQQPAATIGTSSLVGPLDLGDLVIVGAGALTHALGYWVAEVGMVGRRRVIDRDHAELHNTNRCLGMTAADAGWPDGLPGGAALDKATIAARLFGAEPISQWYHEWLDTEPVTERPDLILPLANEHGVRALVAARGEPLLLHATTSANWTAELHRHRPDIDDCPACRLPETTAPTFACSTGPADPRLPASDAALPFLSAAAGLMLVVALAQLGERGRLLTDRHNHWRLCFEQLVQIRPAVRPASGCPHTPPKAARERIRSAWRRWDDLDSEQD
jgi:hypothetical protein